jgi:hypothetical protein
MYLIEDVWGIVKSYMFHNIKIHGKHLINDPFVKKYNETIKNIPKPSVPLNGPRIVYSSMTNTIRFIKFIYHFNFYKSNSIRHRTIMEIQMLKHGYDAENLTCGSKFREEYFNQYK